MGLFFSTSINLSTPLSTVASPQGRRAHHMQQWVCLKQKPGGGGGEWGGGLTLTISLLDIMVRCLSSSPGGVPEEERAGQQLFLGCTQPAFSWHEFILVLVWAAMCKFAE